MEANGIERGSWTADEQHSGGLAAVPWSLEIHMLSMPCPRHPSEGRQFLCSGVAESCKMI